MAAENYFSVDREPSPTEPTDDTTQTEEASGVSHISKNVF